MNTTANTEWTAETMLKFVMSELTPAEFFKFVLEVNEVNEKLWMDSLEPSEQY